MNLVAAAGLGETASVGFIGYVARRGYYDAKGRIRKAAEDGEAVFHQPSGGSHGSTTPTASRPRGSGRPKSTLGRCPKNRQR